MRSVDGCEVLSVCHKKGMLQYAFVVTTHGVYFITTVMLYILYTHNSKEKMLKRIKFHLLKRSAHEEH